MITPTVPAFYLIQATAQAAELIAATISPRVMADIKGATVLSSEFQNDIAPIQELDAAIETIRAGLVGYEIQGEEIFNPLFYPSTDEGLDAALEVEMKNDNVLFTGMGGNPYIAKTTEVTVDGTIILAGSVNFQQFELPQYDVIMEKRKTPLN